MIRSPLLKGLLLVQSHGQPLPGIMATVLAMAAGALGLHATAAAQTASTGTTTQYWVQMGANPDEAASRAQWEKFRAQGSGLFDRVGNRIQRADLGPRGVFYRVQVGPFASAREAGQFCAQLKGRQIDCFLPPPETVRATPSDAARNAAPERPAAPVPPSAGVAPPTKPAEAKPAEVKPSEARPAEKPKPETASAPPRTAPVVPPPKAAAPAEKPKEPASARKLDPMPETPGARPETRPPTGANAEKPDAPISTAPGLPGVLD